MENNQQTLKSKIFIPFFFTMGLGAFNDNLFKSAIAIFITYTLPEKDSNFLVQLSAGLFILPFFIFSGISGQICDKYEKSKLMQKIKILEIVIMLFGAIAFTYQNIPFLLGTLFLMGAQSTLFGPVKYSILPQHLKGKLLLKGNSYTSMGTFIFILIGTILGGFLVGPKIVQQFNYQILSLSIVFFAILGYLASIFIPVAIPANPTSKINFNIPLQTWKTLSLAHHNRFTLQSIYGISWFWFFGFFFMASLPLFCRDILKGDEYASTFLLGVISIGMGIGSIVGEKLTKGQIRMGIVGIAGLFLGIFAIIFSSTPKNLATEIIPFPNLIYSTPFILSSLSLLLVGITGGLLIVPLYTQLQIQTPDHLRSRFIASNNIMNALFMVSAAVFAMILFKFNFKIEEIFFIVSAIQIFLSVFYIIINPRDFYLTFFNILMRIIYNIKVEGEENIQENGPVIFASNHVSFIDPLLLTAIFNRPPIFIMDQFYFDLKWLQWFYLSAKAIPIVPKKICPDGLEKAMNQTIAKLNEGEAVAIFPEGFITKDGELLPFKEGIKRFGSSVKELNLYPVAICGMYGSWFSRHKNGKAMNGFPWRRSIRTKLSIKVGNPIKGPDITPELVHKEISTLRGNWK